MVKPESLDNRSQKSRCVFLLCKPYLRRRHLSIENATEIKNVYVTFPKESRKGPTCFTTAPRLKMGFTGINRRRLRNSIELLEILPIKNA